MPKGHVPISKFNAAVRDYANEINNLNKDIAFLQQRVYNLENDKITLTSDLNQANYEIELSGNKINKLLTEVTSKTKENYIFKSRVDALQHILERIQQIYIQDIAYEFHRTDVRLRKEDGND